MEFSDNLHSSRILIVDDEEANVTFARRVLSIDGYSEVKGLHDPTKAIDLIETIKPNLLVLDLHMPRVDGFAILEHVRGLDQELASIPILMLTGDAEQEVRTRALKMGATDFLVKPFHALEFQLRVRNLLTSYWLRAELANQNDTLQETVRERTEELREGNSKLEVESFEREQAVAKLKKTEERVTFLLSVSPAAIYSARATIPFRATFISDHVRTQLGYEPEQFVNDPNFWKDRLHPDDAMRVWKGLPKVLEDERHVTEYRLRHNDGSYRWMRDETVVIRAEDGSSSEIVGSWIDITDSKLAEEAMAKQAMELYTANARMQEFDALKSEFVATASHEMRTPLTVIREFASLLRDGAAGETQGEKDEAFGTILRNCDRLSGLLENLLDFHKIEAGKMSLQRSRTNFLECLSQCFKDFQPKCRSKGIELILEASESLPPLLADAQQCLQVLVNLIGNAIKFTPDGGSISIVAKQIGRFAEISIQDTGRGMEQADLGRIFEAFRQVDREDGPGARGTGLGLTISRHIVEAHGGEIRVTSTPGQGTTFTFTLPVWEKIAELSAFIADRWPQGDDSGGRSLVLVRPIWPGSSEGADGISKLFTVARTLRKSDASLAMPDLNCVAWVVKADALATKEALDRLQFALKAMTGDDSAIAATVTDLDDSQTSAEWANVAINALEKESEAHLVTT